MMKNVLKQNAKVNRHNILGSGEVIAHLSMFFACAFWGLMAPLGKDAMTHGLDGLTMNRQQKNGRISR